MKSATTFVNCFICERELTDTYWYHNHCSYDVNDEKLLNVISQLSDIPEHLPKDQHYKYIRRIYERVILNE
jgi:hypothetical protein